MWLTIVWVVLTVNGDEALIKPVDEVIADKHREACVFTKWVNSVHYPLIVSKDRGNDKGTLTILLGLVNMLECSMGLVGVAQADLVKFRGADFWPSKLSDLPLNLYANLKCISIGQRQVEIQGLKKDGAVLHACGKDLKLVFSQAERAEVVGTGILREGVRVSMAVGHCMSGLQKLKIVETGRISRVGVQTMCCLDVKSSVHLIWTKQTPWLQQSAWLPSWTSNRA
jgi:hypothetical protein